MKILLFTMVVAALVVTGVSAAGAKYAGYLYNIDGDTHPGYLSWDGALSFMSENNVDAALMLTPHASYIATTTKCAVCHSVHRAASDYDGGGIGGVGSYWRLTPGGAACTMCHTPGGANPVSTLIEWPTIYSDGGPHASENCIGACHSSIHGGNSSEYAAMNIYLLGPDKDAAIAYAFATGNEYTETDSLENDAVNRGRGIITEETFRDYVLPEGNQGPATMRAMRAMATGYTCGASGCHNASQFVVNKAGYANARTSDPEDPYGADTFFAGHKTNITHGCAPCHQNDTGDVGAESACGQCHDARGKATGTTAFPHANRNITFLETADGENWIDKAAGPDGRNLWMYYGDATMRDASGNPDPSGTISPSRTLLENAVVSGNQDGLIDRGDIIDGVCLKCHAYMHGEYHVGTDRYSEFYKADDEITGNELDFSKF